jgi:putative transposase
MEMDSKIKTKENFDQAKKIDEFIIDESLIRSGSQYVWLWVANEPKNKQILQMNMSFERTMLVVVRFIVSPINKYGKHRTLSQQTVERGIRKHLNS